MSSSYYILGTCFVFDDASRQVSADSRLKYDQTGPMPVILVPQPSNDPNDPLVCSKRVLVKGSIAECIELANMEAGHDGPDTVFCLRDRFNAKPAACRKYSYPIFDNGKGLHANSATDRLSFMRRWGGGVFICALSKGLGQTAFIPIRNYSYNNK